MNIVCFGRTNWSDPAAPEQNLLSRLARRGHRVLAIDPSPAGVPPNLLASLWDWRKRCAVTQVQDGLHVMTPRPLEGIPRWLAARLHRQTIRQTAEQLGLWAPVVIYLSPMQQGLPDAVDPAALVYFALRPQDRAAGMEHLGGDEALLRRCDMALAETAALMRRCASIQANSFLLERGLDLDELGPAALAAMPPHTAWADLPRPRIGYVGPVDRRIDQDLVVELARRFSTGTVVLAGPVDPGTDVSRLERLANLRMTGGFDLHSPASVYRELDVAVVPFLQGNVEGDPPRTFEYLASDLPTVARVMVPGAEAMVIAAAPREFTAAVERELASPARLNLERRRAAESAGWQRRADQLEGHLGQAVELAAQRRARDRRASPRPDRHGRQAVRVEPRLDGKDESVRLLHDNYTQNRLSAQQNLFYLASRVAGLINWGARCVGRTLHGEPGLVRRILVVRNGHLGDTVVFLPTLAALRRKYPQAKITVALAPDSGARSLLEASPYVDEVMPLDFFNRSRRDRLRGAIRLLACGFDLAVGGVWYFHLPEAVFSGAPRRLGLYDGHPLQRYADRVVMLDPILHEAENNLRLVELVTGRGPPQERVPRLYLDEPQLARLATQLRQRFGLDDKTPLVALHPGSKRPSRRWPADRFAELAVSLLRDRPDLHVVFTGAGDEERALAGTIRGMIPPNLHNRTHDATDVSDLLSVIGLYDTCKLLVCNDTGVMHVARARGVPLVAIIGPENDRRWGPHPLGPGPAVSVRNQVPGTPHGKWDCEWNLSLASIDPDRIKVHCDALLDGSFLTTHGIQPVTLGDEQYFPLVTDIRRLSFAQLGALGLALPKVAVVLARDPALLGEVGTAATPQALAAACRELRRQNYPAVQRMLVVEDAQPFADLDMGETRIVVAPRNDPDAAWAAVLGGTDARLFWLCSPGTVYPATALSSRVSVFLRGPHAQVVDDQRAWPTRTLLSPEIASGRWLVERSALEVLLCHPLRVPLQADMAEIPQVREPAAA